MSSIANCFLSSPLLSSFIFSPYRCIDPSELGTLLSGVRCPLCADPARPDAVCLPLEPLRPGVSPWRCRVCQREVGASQAEEIREKAGGTCIPGLPGYFLANRANAKLTN